MTDLLVRGTALVSFILYILALALRLFPGVRRPKLARAAWTGGCFVFLLHVACAFQFVHHWSHAAAYQATALRTAEVTGLDWGGGLFFNYAFTLVWLGDVCWWWLALPSYQRRSPMISWLVQGFLGFMWLNATVVFGRMTPRWAGAIACLILSLLWWRRTK